MSQTGIEVEIEVPGWTQALPAADMLTRAAAEAALAQVERSGGVVVLLTDDEAVAALNRDFRGKVGPTNVLSFPAAANPEQHLGDIALALGVCAREADEQGKSLAHHLQHLVAHGVLHLVGFDHQTDSEAEEMEALERRILQGLGVADPYAGEDQGQGQHG